MTNASSPKKATETLLRRRQFLGALAAAPLALVVPKVHASGFPNKPIRLIVPFPAGGGVDIFARPLAHGLSEALGVPVVVENIGGAAGRIGTQRVTQASADGYTLLITNDTLVAADALASVGGQDILLERLAPVTLGISSCNLFVTHPKSGFNDPAGYLKALKDKDGKLAIGVPGWGTAHHLTSASLNHQLGVDATHVPYRGGAPLLADLLNGTLDAGVVTMAAAVAHIQVGSLVGIAVTSPQRAAALPDVPTLTDTIAKGFTHKTWQGVLAPKDTPAEVQAALHAGIVKALQNPRVQEVLPGQGFDAEGLPGGDFSSTLSASFANFQQVVKAAGIQANQG